MLKIGSHTQTQTHTKQRQQHTRLHVFCVYFANIIYSLRHMYLHFISGTFECCTLHCHSSPVPTQRSIDLSMKILLIFFLHQLELFLKMCLSCRSVYVNIHSKRYNLWIKYSNSLMDAIKTCT